MKKNLFPKPIMRVLTKHFEQDGFVYIRVKRLPKMKGLESFAKRLYTQPTGDDGRVLVDLIPYMDNAPGCRTITSRKVEAAVEFYDYAQKCEDEGLIITIGHNEAPEENKYCVFDKHGFSGFGATLREAYHRRENAQKAAVGESVSRRAENRRVMAVV